MRNRGFTLIELIVVISVIAVLAGIILPTMGAIIDDARQARAVTEVKHIATACLQYEKLNGYLPYQGLPGGAVTYSYAYTYANMNQLNTLCVKFFSRRILNDPFGQPYRYWQYASMANMRAVALTAGKNQNFSWVWNSTRWNNREEPPTTETSYYMVFK
jgi:prepilin-type N-terminal cleavage/methylation domain-containing protein